MLPAAIYVASENSVSTFTNPYDSPELLVLTSDYPNQIHATDKDEPYHGRMKRGYCYSKHDEKICLKKTRLYCYTCSDK